MFKFKNRFDIFARFNADGTPQGGDPGNDDGSGSNRAQGAPGSDPAAAFQRRLKEYGDDAMQFASKLFDENFNYRERARQLQQEIEGLKSKAVSDDDLKALETYKALGDPETVKQGLTQATELQGKLDKLERDAALRQVAETAGYKPTVLARLEATARAEGKELGFEVKEVEQDGEKRTVAFVKDGDAETPLAEYAATEWADFLPALTATTSDAPTTPTGVRYPPQHPGRNGAPPPSKSVADEFVAERDEKAKEIKNPLLPE